MFHNTSRIVEKCDHHKIAILVNIVRKNALVFTFLKRREKNAQNTGGLQKTRKSIFQEHQKINVSYDRGRKNTKVYKNMKNQND